MGAEILIEKLARVKRVAPDRWTACCPAHDDKRPSLSIRELPDGRVLVHCFGGCGIDEVLGAVGLTTADLFPARRNDDAHFVKGERRAFPASDALRALAEEAVFTLLCARQLAAGQPLCDSDKARLLVACSRLAEAVRACGVGL